MLPHTRMLMDAMREDSDPPDIAPVREDIAHVSREDPRFYTLALRKKHQTAMLKKMLQDAGYKDLARMTGFRREQMEDGE